MSDRFYTAVYFVQSITPANDPLTLTIEEAIHVVKNTFPELFGEFEVEDLRAEVERRAGR